VGPDRDQTIVLRNPYVRRRSASKTKATPARARRR